MQLDPQDAKELKEANSEILRTLDGIMRVTNTAKAENNMGGAGVWMATTAALVMFAVNVMQSRQIDQQTATISEINRRVDSTNSELNRKYERMQDYLNAIYAQAPHLKPQEQESK